MAFFACFPQPLDCFTQGSLARRIHDIFDTDTNVSNIDRLNQLKSGARMIADHPLTGVGPGMVRELYPAYRTTRAVKESTSHLHNTPVQIFAETELELGQHHQIAFLQLAAVASDASKVPATEDLLHGAVHPRPLEKGNRREDSVSKGRSVGIAAPEDDRRRTRLIGHRRQQ